MPSFVICAAAQMASMLAVVQPLPLCLKMILRLVSEDLRDIIFDSQH